MTGDVLFFHSILQLIIAISSEYSDHPNRGPIAQNKPINIEIMIAVIASLFRLFLDGTQIDFSL